MAEKPPEPKQPRQKGTRWNTPRWNTPIGMRPDGEVNYVDEPSEPAKNVSEK